MHVYTMSQKHNPLRGQWLFEMRLSDFSTSLTVDQVDPCDAAENSDDDSVVHDVS
jgi:hypothetical protein